MKTQIKLLLGLFIVVAAFQNCGNSPQIRGIAGSTDAELQDDPFQGSADNSGQPDADEQDPIDSSNTSPVVGAIPSNCDVADNNKYGPYPAGNEPAIQVKKCLHYASAEDNSYEFYVLNRIRYIDMQGVERQIARVECRGDVVGSLKIQRHCEESRWCQPGQDFRPGLDGNPMPCRTVSSSTLIRVRD